MQRIPVQCGSGEKCKNGGWVHFKMHYGTPLWSFYGGFVFHTSCLDRFMEKLM